MSNENPLWGEDKIANEMKLKLGVEHSTATVRKYKNDPLTPKQKSQRWLTFLKNHASAILACDVLVQHTIAFKVFYIFVIMNLKTRKVYINVTEHPTLMWVKQQIREATGDGANVRFMIHDNDRIYGQYGAGGGADVDGRHCRSHLDRWLGCTMGIEGVPIPYGAPRANAYCERFNRTLREEALNHFVFLSERHIRRVVLAFAEYYNRARPHQGTHCIPDPWPAVRTPPSPQGKVISMPVLNGLHHDYRRAA